MMIQNAQDYSAQVIALLSDEELPTGDLPVIIENFVVALDNGIVCGVAGLEVYGDYGLLRSLAVGKPYRNQGIAGKLLLEIDCHAAELGLREIYLLTETAPGYFLKNDFRQINRADVPAAVQQSSEFSHVCPQSAIVMKKSVKNK